MNTQFTGARKSRPFGLYKAHFISNLHRVSTSYFRARPKRRGQIGRRHATARASVTSAKREPKNVTWLPGDDYLLINSIMLTCNLTEVHQTVRFASPFTEKEIEMRWRALLFDPVTSRTALQAIAQLSPLIKAKLNRLVPFSDHEDALIAKITLLDVFPDGEIKPLSNLQLSDSVFAKLLADNSSVFFSGRDELDLFRQWNRLQSCHVIKEGSFSVSPRTRNDPDAVSNSALKTKSGPICSEVEEPVFSTPSRDQIETTLGGNPESFSDTELLLEETVSSALSAGLDKLTEPSTAARRHRLMAQSSYHGFQSVVTESVISALMREKQQQQEQQQEDQTRRVDDPTWSGRGSLPLLTHRSIALGSTPLSFDAERSGPGPSSHTTSSPNPAISAEFDFRRRVELYRYRKRLMARLRRTAEEAKRWTRLVEIRAVSGLQLTDPQPLYPVLASLTGTRTRFLLKEKEVTFGRSSLVYRPHIDLSREGDSSRVSRCHGRIRLAASGIFWLANFSKHPVFVDGNPVLTDEEVELKDLATVLIARLAFRFDVNHVYVRQLCHDPEAALMSASRALDESGNDSVSTADHSRSDAVSHVTGACNDNNQPIPSPTSIAQSDPSSEWSSKN